jgi:hypothetical protein
VQGAGEQELVQGAGADHAGADCGLGFDCGPGLYRFDIVKGFFYKMLFSLKYFSPTSLNSGRREYMCKEVKNLVLIQSGILCA